MKPRSLIFTIFGAYIRNYGSEIWIGSLTKLLSEFGYSEPAVRAAISRMFKQGWVESRKVANKSYYSMSVRGLKRLEEAAQRIYHRDEGEGWDGNWCIVNYCIPEENRELRDQFRKELGWLGFGMLSNGTWISPHPVFKQVEELIDQFDIGSCVEIFSSVYNGRAEDSRRLVERCWNLDQINAEYKDFIDDYLPRYKEFLEKGGVLTNESNSFCFIEKTQLVHQYQKFLFMDPNLPKELLPQGWIGEEASQLFNEYHNLLDPGATHFFEEVFESASVTLGA